MDLDALATNSETHRGHQAFVAKHRPIQSWRLWWVLVVFDTLTLISIIFTRTHTWWITALVLSGRAIADDLWRRRADRSAWRMLRAGDELSLQVIKNAYAEGYRDCHMGESPLSGHARPN